MKYLPLIQAIKNTPDGFFFHQPNEEINNFLLRLLKIGVIDLQHRYDNELRPVLVATIDRPYQPEPQPAVIAPNPPQIATPARVQVQWWQKGARQGLFSQQAYDVLSQDEKWTTITLMGKPHVVATSRTRSESAAA